VLLTRGKDTPIPSENRVKGRAMTLEVLTLRPKGRYPIRGRKLRNCGKK
jgi:hypothetical protein